MFWYVLSPLYYCLLLENVTPEYLEALAEQRRKALVEALAENKEVSPAHLIIVDSYVISLKFYRPKFCVCQNMRTWQEAS